MEVKTPGGEKAYEILKIQYKSVVEVFSEKGIPHRKILWNLSGEKDLPIQILKKIKKKKLNYFIIDLTKNNKFKKNKRRDIAEDQAPKNTKPSNSWSLLRSSNYWSNIWF